MKGSSFYLFAVLFFVLLISNSCGPGSLAISDYNDFVQNPENGLVKTLEMGEYTLTAQYEPAEFTLLKKYKNKPEKKSFENELAELNGNAFFSLTVRDKTGKITTGASLSRNQTKLSYFSFSFQQDIFLEEEGKKQHCSLFYFDNLQDQMGDKALFVLGFPLSGKANAEKTLIIDSPELKIGIVKFRISSEALRDIPKLKVG